MAGKHPFGVENLIPSRGSERLIVRPDGSLHLDGRRSKAMVESRTGSYSASNAYYDGVNWQRYDTAQAAAAVWSDPVAGTLVLLTAAAGANPIAWTTNTLSTITGVATPLTLTAGVLDIQQASAVLEGSMSAAQYALVAQLGTDSGWAAPGLAANWANFGAGWANAGYKKDELGRVSLRGMIAKGIAVVAGETIFVLPAGFRPTAQEYFAINSNGAFGTIWITAAGAVNLQIGNAAYVSLSGISFDTV